MMNFQEALLKLISPASANGEVKARPALMQVKPAGQADRIVDYAELETLVSRAAEAFDLAGVKSHDTVVLCSPNTPELVAAILATWALKATAIPVDFRMTAGELENVASRVSAKVIYSAGDISSQHKVVKSTDWPPTAKKLGSVEIDPDQPALVILTSGTTGMPKGAVHDLGSLLNNITELAHMAQLSKDDIALLPLPVSHVLGLEVLLAALLNGACIAFADFTPANFADYIIRIKPTFIVGVPTIYGALASLPIPPETLNSARILLSGGAPLPVSLADDFKGKFNKHITQGYGSTETKIVTLNIDGPSAAVGKPVPSATIEIVNDNDEVLADGEVGEIRISGNMLMQGYLNQPEATAKVLHHGHYHTGDIGYKEDGRIFISGRSKEMIIVAGNKIFPSEVESIIRQHPLAGEVAVIGVPHKKLGQLVKAIVVVQPGDYSNQLASSADDSKISAQELESKFREFCKQNLKRELRPMDWDFRAATNPLPKTNTGKIDKKQLENSSG